MREGMERGLPSKDRSQLRALLGSVMDNLDQMEAELNAAVSAK